MLKAKRMSVPGLRTSLRDAFASLWTIEGKPGIWWYVTGCKKDHVPEDPEAVVAETNGATAVFKLDKVVMAVVTAAIEPKSPLELAFVAEPACQPET